MHAPPRWVERYIGIPFIERGFTLAGCHCWGLVCLVYELELDRLLARHDVISSADLRRIVGAVEREKTFGPWRQVCEQTPFDVVLMRSIARSSSGVVQAPAHFGVAVGRRHVLHVEEGGEAVCVDRAHHSIAGRLLGLYRHRDAPA